MATLTVANSKFIITYIPLGLTFQVQGYSVDDAFTADSVTTSETLMGVDGRKSQGWIPSLKTFNFTLQADSDTNVQMDAIIQYEKTVRETGRLDAVITIPGISRSYTLTNGTLKTFTPFASNKKTLQPRMFGIDWENIEPAVL